MTRCPACYAEIDRKLHNNDLYKCKKCNTEFLVRWNGDRRDYDLIDPGEVGKDEPLKAPKGTVRAAIILLVSITAWVLIVAGKDVPFFLLQLVLITMGYYFAFRGFTAVLAAKHLMESSTNATPRPGTQTHGELFLPKGWVRWIVLIGFGIAACVMFGRGMIIPWDSPGAISTWNYDYIQFFFILAGITIGYLTSILWLKRGKELVPFMKHVRAICVLLIAVALVIFTLTSAFVDIGVPIPSWAITFCVGIIGFYFGAR